MHTCERIGMLELSEVYMYAYTICWKCFTSTLEKRTVGRTFLQRVPSRQCALCNITISLPCNCRRRCWCCSNQPNSGVLTHGTSPQEALNYVPTTIHLFQLEKRL